MAGDNALEWAGIFAGVIAQQPREVGEVERPELRGDEAVAPHAHVNEERQDDRPMAPPLCDRDDRAPPAELLIEGAERAVVVEMHDRRVRVSMQGEAEVSEPEHEIPALAERERRVESAGRLK